MADYLAECRALRQYRVPLEPIDKAQGMGQIFPDSPLYLSTCQTLFQTAEVMQKTRCPARPPRLWTAANIELMAGFSARDGVPMTFHGYLYLAPEPVNSVFTLSNRGGQIALGAANYIDPAEPFLETRWNHEGGHIWDYRLLSLWNPNTRSSFDPGTFRSHADARMAIVAYLELMRRQLEPGEQEAFLKLAQETFGTVHTAQQGLTIYQMVAEMFRRGEEISNPDFERMAFHISPPCEDGTKRAAQRPHYRFENSWGELLDLNNLLTYAPLMEAPNGLWERYRAEMENEADPLADINPRHLEFFRLGIRAASRYFSDK